MKRLFAITVIFAFSFSVFADPIRLSEPVVADEASETFGAILDTRLPGVTLQSLVAEPDKHLGKAFKLETRIGKVCQKKGCFFVAQQGRDALRVSFKDYGFFIPTDSSGKTVTLAGKLIEKQLAPEQVAHFESDLQEKSAAIKPGLVYEIVAESIQIPRS